MSGSAHPTKTDAIGPPDDGPPSHLIENSLHAAHREAVFSSLVVGLTDPFMAPYALALGANAFQVGLLTSMRNLLVSLVQLGSAEAVRWAGSRKALVLWTVGIHATLWLPIAFVQPIFGQRAVAALIALFTMGSAISALGGPAWGSLLSEYLAPEARGRFFGSRARVSGLANTLGGLSAGIMLHLNQRRPVVGFGILAALAAVSRWTSWAWLHRFHEEPWRDEPHLRFTFWAFIRQFRRSNFARFSLCIGGLSLATNIAAPYFTVYMLEPLNFGYIEYTAVMMSAAVLGFLTSPFWGRLGDDFGNHAVLRWTSMGTAVLPLLWLISPHPAWFVFSNAVGALLWGGVNLCAVNFLYDSCRPGKRHTCLAYFNVINGVSIGVGALLGGAILSALPWSGRDAYAIVFGVSAALRVAAALSLHHLVKEVRTVRDFGLREVMMDTAMTRISQVLGFFSVKAEAEMGSKRRWLRRRGRSDAARQVQRAD